MKQSIQKIYHPIRDYVMILFGGLLFAFGFQGFILSHDIIPGGLTGICSLIYFYSGKVIPVSNSYFVLNILLLVLAYKVMGRRFALNSLWGVLCVSVSFWLFEQFLDVNNPILQGEPFMSIIIGAVLCGAGLGIIFAANGSTGGTDIIGAIINKYKDISIGRALFMFDFVIIGSSFFLFHDVQKIVYALVEMAVNNYILDRVLNANKQSVQFMIFTRKPQEISQRIISDLDRSCTILDGVGAFSETPIKVIILLAKNRESVTIFRLIKSVDSNAFISQCDAKGVYGEGFDQIKT